MLADISPANMYKSSEYQNLAKSISQGTKDEIYRNSRFPFRR